MPKYRKEFKLKVVLEYFSGESGGQPAVSKKYNISWLSDFIMSFALIIGMAAGVFFEGVL